MNINNPVYNENKDQNKPEIKPIEEIVGDYIFTSDNFVKMILIRKLYELMNNGVCNMEIVNIYAGVTDKEIVHFLYDDKEINGKIVKDTSIIPKGKILKEKENLKQ